MNVMSCLKSISDSRLCKVIRLQDEMTSRKAVKLAFKISNLGIGFSDLITKCISFVIT
jgi:hypothetical protein